MAKLHAAFIERRQLLFDEVVEQIRNRPEIEDADDPVLGRTEIARGEQNLRADSTAAQVQGSPALDVREMFLPLLISGGPTLDHFRLDD